MRVHWKRRNGKVTFEPGLSNERDLLSAMG